MSVHLTDSKIPGNAGLRILIIQTAFMGDVILSCPLIQNLQEQLPNPYIDYLADPRGLNVLESNPLLREVIVYDKNGKDKGIRGFFRILKTLRARNYDVALIPHRSLRSSLLAYLSGIPRRIGFSTSAGSRLFTDVVNYRIDAHEIDRNLHLLGPLGIFREGTGPEIFPTTEDEEVVNEYFSKNGIRNDAKIVGFAPGSVWATKRWPLENYAGLIRMVIEKDDCTALLFGGEGDSDICTFIKKETGSKCFNAAGIFSPRQSVVAMKRLKLLVTNDNGALHLGIAASTTVAAIFGPTVTSFGFAPYGEGHKVIESLMECRPCSKHGSVRCPLVHFRCMKDLGVDKVYQLISPMLM